MNIYYIVEVWRGHPGAVSLRAKVRAESEEQALAQFARGLLLRVKGNYAESVADPNYYWQARRQWIQRFARIS